MSQSMTHQHPPYLQPNPPTRVSGSAPVRTTSSSSPSLPPGGSKPSSTSTHVNLTGHWILDADASDPLDPLLAYYHGVALTPAASMGVVTKSELQNDSQQSSHHHAKSTLIQNGIASSTTAGSNDASTEVHPTINSDTDASLSGTVKKALEWSPDSVCGLHASSPDMPSGAVSGLVISHNARHFTSHQLSFRPTYSVDGGLQRLVPLPGYENVKLPIHETYKLDAEWRENKTGRGKVIPATSTALTSSPSASSSPCTSSSPSSSSILSRAYYAPHGSSLVVDTRQSSSEYELERTERFMQQDGQRMIVEIRILSAAPAPVAVEEKPKQRHVIVRPSSPRKHDHGAGAGLVVVSKRCPVNTPHVATNKGAAEHKPMRETMCIRRVYRRVPDAVLHPSFAEMLSATTRASSSTSSTTSASTFSSAASTSSTHRPSSISTKRHANLTNRPTSPLSSPSPSPAPLPSPTPSPLPSPSPSPLQRHGKKTAHIHSDLSPPHVSVPPSASTSSSPPPPPALAARPGSPPIVASTSSASASSSSSALQLKRLQLRDLAHARAAAARSKRRSEIYALNHIKRLYHEEMLRLWKASREGGMTTGTADSNNAPAQHSLSSDGVISSCDGSMVSTSAPVATRLEFDIASV